MMLRFRSCALVYGLPRFLGCCDCPRAAAEASTSPPTFAELLEESASKDGYCRWMVRRFRFGIGEKAEGSSQHPDFLDDSALRIREGAFDDGSRKTRKRMNAFVLSEVIRVLQIFQADCKKYGENAMRLHVGSLLAPYSGKLDPYSVNMVLKSLNDPILCLAIFQWAKLQPKSQPNLLIYNTMIRILGRARKFERIEWVMFQMKKDNLKPNVVVYTELIKSFGFGKQYVKAMEVYSRMKEERIHPDVVTYSVLIDVHCNEGRFEEALKTYEEFIRTGIPSNSIINTNMIKVFGKMRRLFDAEKIFHAMNESNQDPCIHAYTSMISIYHKNNLLKKSVDLFQKMINAGLKPDIYIYCTMLSVYQKMGLKDEIMLMNKEMHSLGVRPNVVWYNSLANHLITDRKYPDAEKVFEDMEVQGMKKNNISFTTLLFGALLQKDYSKARHWISAMDHHGFLPYLKAYSHLLLAYNAESVKPDKDEEALEAIWDLMGLIKHPVHGFMIWLKDSVLQKRSAEPEDDTCQSKETTKSTIRKGLDTISNELYNHRLEFVDLMVDCLVKHHRHDIAEMVWEELPRQRLHIFTATSPPSSPALNSDPGDWTLDLSAMSEGMGLTCLRMELLHLLKRYREVRQVPNRLKISLGRGYRNSGLGTVDVKAVIVDFLIHIKFPCSEENLTQDSLHCKARELKEWFNKPASFHALHFA